MVTESEASKRFKREKEEEERRRREEEERLKREEEGKKKRQQSLRDRADIEKNEDKPVTAQPIPSGPPAGNREIEVISRGGKQFVVPKGEFQELQRRGKAGETLEEFRAREADLRVEAQQRQLQDTGAPVRRQLDPKLVENEELPVFGPLGRILGEELIVRINDVRRMTGSDKRFFIPPEFDIQPELLKTQALSAIEAAEIKKGLTKSERFGEFVESLSLGGLTNFAAEKPSENVQTILRELKTEKTRATNAEIKVKDGTWRQSYGEETVNEIENNIQRMESRMKLLIQNSPEFKFNSDGVNFIETKILEARERLFAAKINMLSGAAKDPSEVELLIALQDSIQTEDFEIPD